jgi:hypothetical protein
MPTPLSITSANAIYLLSIPGVFPVAQQLTGFGVDEAFDTEAAEISEIKLGVDGVFAAGWTPRITKQTITLLAASQASFTIFETWIAAQDTTMSVVYATGTIILPAIQRKYTLYPGALTRFPALPNVKKVLADRQFEISWGWPITSGPS